jgi:hypothetical protein
MSARLHFAKFSLQSEPETEEMSHRFHIESSQFDLNEIFRFRLSFLQGARIVAISYWGWTLAARKIVNKSSRNAVW